MMYPLSLPLVGMLIYGLTRQPGMALGPAGEIASAMGAFAIVGFLGTGQFAVNQFGYVGNGLRRYLLLPTDPAAALRSCSYTFVLLNAVSIAVGLTLWPLIARRPFDPLTLPLLAGCGLAGNRAPLRNVPLAEPASTRRTPSAPHNKAACRRDTC